MDLIYLQLFFFMLFTWGMYFISFSFFHLIPYEWSTLKWSMFVCLSKWINFPPFHRLSFSHQHYILSRCHSNVFHVWLLIHNTNVRCFSQRNPTDFFLHAFFFCYAIKFSNENQIKIFSQYIYSFRWRAATAFISVCFCWCYVYLWRKAQNYCKWNSLHHSWKLNKSDINVSCGDHTMEKLVFICWLHISYPFAIYCCLSLSLSGSPFFARLSAHPLYSIWKASYYFVSEPFLI